MTLLAAADADRRLATDAAGGDEAAFAAIFERHRNEVYRIARAVAGDRETALDAVQETFLKVHAGLGRFRAASSLRTWIVRIVSAAAALLVAAALTLRRPPVDIVKEVRFESVHEGKVVRFELTVYREKEKPHGDKPTR